MISTGCSPIFRAPGPPPAAPAAGPRRAAAWPFPLAAVALFVLFMAAAGSAARGPGHWHAAWAFWSFWWLIPIGIFATRRWLAGGRPQGRR